MAKKKKSSAQDLIDSLLDEPRDARSLAAKPPPLPGGIGAAAPSFRPSPRKVKNVSESTFGSGVRFELDLNKADLSLKLVGDRTHAQARSAKPAPLADESALSPSELRNAPTLVGSAPSGGLVSDESLGFDIQPPAGANGDKTVALPERSGKVPTLPSAAVDRKTETEVRFGVGKMGGSAAAPSAKNPPPSGAVFTSAEASLKQSESLRIAQMRIHEFEQEIERLRRENEKFASAGETLRRRTDELLARAESLEAQTRESRKIHEEEKKVLRGQLSSKEREGVDLRAKLEETETRLEGNFKRIRVRERELEHRLEIVKMENATIVSTKDEMIMRLKREIDQLKFETENGKVRSQELYNQYKEKQETIGRVVRALRIALTILEGDEENRKRNDE